MKRIARVRTDVPVGMKAILKAHNEAGMPAVLRMDTESAGIDRFEFIEPADDETTLRGHEMMAGPGFPGDRIA